MMGMDIDPETARRHAPTEEVWKNWQDVRELARRLARAELAVAALRQQVEAITSAFGRPPEAKPAFRAEEGGGA